MLVVTSLRTISSNRAESTQTKSVLKLNVHIALSDHIQGEISVNSLIFGSSRSESIQELLCLDSGS